MNQTSENGKKPSFGPNFGPFCPIRATFFFFFFFQKLLASSVTRYHGQLSSCTISEKTDNLILTKLSDGRTDGREWFHRTRSTNVEHLTSKTWFEGHFVLCPPNQRNKKSLKLFNHYSPAYTDHNCIQNIRKKLRCLDDDKIIEHPAYC